MAELTSSKYGQFGCWTETREQKQSDPADSTVIRMLSSLFTTLGEKRDFLTIGEDKLNVPTVSNSFSPIFFQSSRGDVSSAFTLTSTVELERENMAIERTESSLIYSTEQR